MNPTERVLPAALKATLAPSPATTRGSATVLNVHPTEPKLIYCTGKLVIIRDLNDPCDCFIYKGHRELTTVAQFSPSGFYVASADVSGIVRIWSYDHPERILKQQVQAFSGVIKDLCWDSESKRIIAVGDGRGLLARVFVWDTGNNVGEIVGHQKCILSVDIRPTRPFRIMTASEDSNTCMYKGPPYLFAHSNKQEHSNFVNCIRFSPKGEYAISVSSDKNICLYDGDTGLLLEKFPVKHTGSIYSICWSPDGSRFLTASADKTVLLWDLATRSVLKIFTFGGKISKVEDMQVSVIWTKEHAISLSLSGQLNYLDLSDVSKPKRVVQGHQVSILNLCVDVELSMIVTGSYDGRVCVWKDKNATALCGNGHTGKITGVSIASSWIASVGWDDCVRFAELTDTGFIYKTVVKLNAQPTDVCIVPKSMEALAIVTSNKGVKLVDQNHIVREGELQSYTATCVAISPCGKIAAVGSMEHCKIYLYEIPSLTIVGELVGHLGALTSLSFSPDGELLAAGDASREVRIWNVEKKHIVVENLWVYHTTQVSSVAWSACGKYVASGASDESIYVWNVEKPTNKKHIKFTHKEGVTQVAFTKENELISVGTDVCVRVWDIALMEE